MCGWPTPQRQKRAEDGIFHVPVDNYSQLVAFLRLVSDQNCILLKITKQLQRKLEDIFETLEFRVRYEKGTFRSGYCILENQNVIVVNKFYPLESKVNVLIGILRDLNPAETALAPEQVKLLRKLNQTELQF